MRLLKIGLAAVLASTLGGVLFAAPGSAAIGKGKMPPDFTGTTLDGQKVTLSSFRGKNPVVLNFFAEFCGPCRKEFPHLKALDEKLGPQGLRVISVSLDEDRATAAVVPNEHKVKFPVIFDPKGGIAEKYGVQAIPHTVVIDRAGKVQTTLIGLDLEALDLAVSQVMRN
ncbi:MAG: redoxin [Armatimonadetes bacterium]|jgi:peroxiredoxin|nr:redoxin [Armatimonadota bacterium]